MSVERFIVDFQAFDSASEWQAALPSEISVREGKVPIRILLEELQAKGIDCRLIKTSRGGAGESYLLDRRTPSGNSQAAIHLTPIP